jgi:diguanylate cyclase
MNDDTILNKITAIHDQTMATLRALNIPPYPSQYKKYFDEIFIEQADQMLKNSKKKDEESESKVCKNCNYLNIAHHSVNAFVETHADISHVAQMQNDFLTNNTLHHGERCSELVDGLSRLGENMSNELKKAQSKIEELNLELEKAVAESITDPLTQITNRKGLIEDLEKVIDAGQSKQLPVVLMMIDADNFKNINDTHGHIAGDKVLYFMTKSIKSILRSGDKLYRFGGEEFTVVLNRCEYEKAFAIAEKIRSKIEHSHLIYSGKTIHITVSIGVTLHRMKDSFDDFIGRADSALYRAKDEGKNKTVLFD